MRARCSAGINCGSSVDFTGMMRLYISWGFGLACCSCWQWHPGTYTRSFHPLWVTNLLVSASQLVTLDPLYIVYGGVAKIFNGVWRMTHFTRHVSSFGWDVSLWLCWYGLLACKGDYTNGEANVRYMHKGNSLRHLHAFELMERGAAQRRLLCRAVDVLIHPVSCGKSTRIHPCSAKP